MNEIDFNKKLSSADYVYLSDHFSQFFKIATDEQKEAHVKATFSNFGEEKKEDFISVFSNLLKKPRDEQSGTISIEDMNIDSETVEILDKLNVFTKGKKHVKDDKLFEVYNQITEIRVLVIKHIKENSNDAIEYSQEQKNLLQIFGFTTEKYEASILKELEQEELEQKNSTEYPSSVNQENAEVGFQLDAYFDAALGETEEYETSIRKELEQENSTEYSSSVNQENAEVEVQLDAYFEAALNNAVDYYDREKIVSQEKNSNILEEPYVYEDSLKQSKIEATIDEGVFDINNEVSNDENSKLNQDTYNSSENEFEVKENPLKRFFSRIYNAIKRKDKPALDEPKNQRVEGNAKKVPIDPEKSQGYDLSDLGMVPANKIVRNNLVDLGRRFMSLFAHNNQNNENTSKGNQYIHVEDAMNQYKVNLESFGKIIPKNVGRNDKNRDESYRSNDNGPEL